MGIGTFTRAASVALVGIGLIATQAFAAVTFDPATGEGFVGKGDVQQALGYNNKQLQENADSLEFTATTTQVTEVSWVCTNDKNENTQERERTTTTTIEGVVADVARERNQITGFNLTGYSGDPTVSTESEGPGVNTCPSGPWTLTSPAGDPEVVSSSTTLSVNGVVLQ